MTILMILVPVVVLIAAFFLLAIMPSRVTSEQYETFGERCYAHRGLFDNERKIPENSLGAFENAMRQGYGCELDVQFTSDRQLIVFHDDNYNRACGDPRKVCQVPFAEAKTLRLFGTAQRIPLFSEVLHTVHGKQPLIVEIKAEGTRKKWNDEICMETLRQLRGYKGPYCIESFHPQVVRWFKKYASDIMRGQLIIGRKSAPDLGFFKSITYSNCLLNFIGRPHFIAMNHLDRNTGLRLSQKFGAMTFMWTIKTEERYQELMPHEDGIIFDSCLLPSQYEV